MISEQKIEAQEDAKNLDLKDIALHNVKTLLTKMELQGLPETKEKTWVHTKMGYTAGYIVGMDFGFNLSKRLAKLPKKNKNKSFWAMIKRAIK